MILLSYPFRPLIIVKGDAKRAFTGIRWMNDSKTIAQKNNRAPKKKFDLQNAHFIEIHSFTYLRSKAEGLSSLELRVLICSVNSWHSIIYIFF